MLCSSWGRGRACCQATSSAALVPMAASTSAEADLLQEHPTQGCWGPQCCPEPGGHAAATQGDRAVSPPLPAREQGREMGPFFPSPPKNCPVSTIPMGTLQPWCWSVLLRNRSLLPRMWGGAAALARGSDGRDVQCSGLHLGLGFLSPSPAAICHTRLDN